MQHIATVTKSSRFPNAPFHAQCSCGTAGTFTDKEQALQYLRNHGLNVKSMSVMNTFELTDDSEKPEVQPEKPSTHIPGIGSAPVSHAALGSEVEGPKVPVSGPPPPPPPPDAK